MQECPVTWFGCKIEFEGLENVPEHFHRCTEEWNTRGVCKDVHYGTAICNLLNILNFACTEYIQRHLKHTKFPTMEVVERAKEPSQHNQNY